MRACIVFLGVAMSSWRPACITNAFSSSFPRNPSFVRPTPLPPPLAQLSKTIATTGTTTCLRGGVGVADIYSWDEEQFEIEVKLAVPPGTSAKDVKFKCSSESIDLRLLNNPDDDGVEKVLLDGSRKTRGKICADGTFWSIEGGAQKEREITITIEKHFVPASSSMGTQTFDAVTDFDWGGVYPNDDEEVTYRKYDEAEELNVREYAAKMGVDIDNLDMSKVDKTMFGSGLGKEASNAVGGLDNMAGDGNDTEGSEEDGKNKGFHFNITQASLEQLTKAGLAKEVIQQGDGTEYELGSDGNLNEDSLFSMLGKGVSDDELREAGLVGESNIPTMWEQQTLPVEEAPGYQKTYDAGNSLGADGIIESEIVESEITPKEEAFVDAGSGTGGEGGDNAEIAGSDAESKVASDTNNEEAMDEETSSKEKPTDPIDMLTVVKLKEILRAQGLKVSGTKQVLRDRLRGHVNTLLQEE